MRKNAETALQVQLQANPELTRQATELQLQYAPKLAQQQYDLTAQYGPQYEQLMRNQFPQQYGLSEQLAGQVGQRLNSQQGYTPEQQAAVDAIRQRQADFMLRNIRSGANIGGTLYGGQRPLDEQRGLTELAQNYAQQDIQNNFNNRGQTLQELIPLLQMRYPQVQTPSAAQFGQSVATSPDALIQAQLQQGQNYVVQPGHPGSPGVFGSFLGGLGRGFGF